MMKRVPVDDTIAYALARLVDDAQTETRSPSHSEIEFEIKKAKLSEYDPNKPGLAPVGKMKRVRKVMISSLEIYPQKVELFALGLINLVRANGGFRAASPNFVGKNEIDNLINAFKAKGILLSYDGTTSHLVLNDLSSDEMTDALKNYVDRAQKGFEDAALIVGTSKDLMEAVAAHVIQKLLGSYPTTANFPTLLGQAFILLGMATSQDKKNEGEHPRKEIERNLFEIACKINRLRNKQGSGHGRPFLPDLTNKESIEAIRLIGIISEKMLNKLNEKKGD